MKIKGIKLISEKKLLKKIEEGVSKKIVWQKPLLLLTQDGDDYNYITDLLRDTYRDNCIVNEPFYNEFVRVGSKIEMSLNGVIVDYHHPDVDLYKYLGGALAYDEKVHRYCVGLVEYESKPVISIICVTDKNCSVENIPEWMKKEFEVVMLKNVSLVVDKYNIDEKLGYIAYMLNVRTKRKAYENFIVNAIYTKVGNPELMPVTQQYVKNPKDPRGFYLLDLYFPQINYGIEIDERQHNSKKHKEADEERTEDIIAAIQCEEQRIRIFDPDDNDKPFPYDKICKEIDEQVSIIKKKIEIVGGVKWETQKDKIDKVLKRGCFDTKDDVSYGTITEIYNICGGNRTGINKGKPAEMLGRCYYRLTDKYKLWVPTLAIKFEDGTTTKARNGYWNFLSEDGKKITEQTRDGWKDPDKDYYYKRVVFMRMKDKFGRPCIKFIGIFKSVSGPGDKHYIRYYERVAESISIEELQKF